MLKDDIINWLTTYKDKNHVPGVVLGLSGGKDSTTVAMLAKKVWGSNVVAVMMPNCTQPDIEDSVEIARELNLKTLRVNIGGIFRSLVDAIELADDSPEISAKAKTNIAPRIRMTVLYAIAQTLGYQVIGTGNYSERYCSWFTKFGDGGCDFNPIQNLTKTEVVEIGLELAKEFGLDEKFITKQPSDGLTGKTDEDNFGFTYDFLDKYLRGKLTEEEKTQNIDIINKIESLHKAGEHKLKMPDGFIYN